jgi:phosphoribosylanthranilate isomerase
MFYMVSVKICGLTSSADARLCAELGAHAIGLNFYPESPRAVSPFTAQKIIRDLPPFVSTVGVFVNWVPEAVVALSRALGLDFAQLHGDETPKVVNEVAKKMPVIKALRIGPGDGTSPFAKFNAASAFLLDGKNAGQFGGTGQTTNWLLAQKASASHRIILAGGLTPLNIAEAITTVRPYAVDVASGVESRPGKKDPGKLSAFFEAVKWADRH